MNLREQFANDVESNCGESEEQCESEDGTDDNDSNSGWGLGPRLAVLLFLGHFRDVVDRVTGRPCGVRVNVRI